MEDIIYIEDIFLKLSTKKVVEINDIVNNKMGWAKPKINITTEGLLRKQILISMSENNSEVISNFANFHISNTKKYLKKAKSNSIANFI